MNNIGPVIRKHRLLKGITLKEMSDKTQLSVSFLSEIERGVANPSMTSMRKISQVLGTSLISLNDQSETENDMLQISRSTGLENANKYISSVKVVRAGQRKRLGYPNIPGYFELLTPDLNRLLEVLYVELEPGFENGPDPITDPPGEKFILVLKGAYQITINGETYDLKEGDTISYPADSSVYYKNVSEHPTELIFIITPPTF